VRILRGVLSPGCRVVDAAGYLRRVQPITQRRASLEMALEGIAKGSSKNDFQVCVWLGWAT
jgi:hypothetical protein